MGPLCRTRSHRQWATNVTIYLASATRSPTMIDGQLDKELENAARSIF